MSEEVGSVSEPIKSLQFSPRDTYTNISMGCPLFHSLLLIWKFWDVSYDFMHALYVFVLWEVTRSNVLNDYCV